jgi:GT2 family glycosyltransferase
VVLNYRTPDQTALTVEMARRSNMAPATIVVVDNGDGVACRQAIAGPSDDVRLIAAGSNLGFSAGCNIGIREALATGADAVLLLNSDVVLPPDCVERLVQALDRQPRPAIVAPVVRSRRWPDRVLSAGIDYDDETGRMRERQALGAVCEVDAVSGCAMLVHRSVFDLVGLLPEEYFFSFEDIAFCHMARAAGLSVSVEPTATAYHEGSATMGSDPQRLYYAARNHLHLGRQTPARSGWHRLRRQYAIVFYNLAHAVTARGGSLPARLYAVGRGVGHHLAGRYGEG